MILLILTYLKFIEEIEKSTVNINYTPAFKKNKMKTYHM